MRSDGNEAAELRAQEQARGYRRLSEQDAHGAVTLCSVPFSLDGMDTILVSAYLRCNATLLDDHLVFDNRFMETEVEECAPCSFPYLFGNREDRSQLIDIRVQHPSEEVVHLSLDVQDGPFAVRYGSYEELSSVLVPAKGTIVESMRSMRTFEWEDYAISNQDYYFTAPLSQLQNLRHTALISLYSTQKREGPMADGLHDYICSPHERVLALEGAVSVRDKALDGMLVSVVANVTEAEQRCANGTCAFSTIHTCSVDADCVQEERTLMLHPYNGRDVLHTLDGENPVLPDIPQDEQWRCGAHRSENEAFCAGLSVSDCRRIDMCIYTEIQHVFTLNATRVPPLVFRNHPVRYRESAIPRKRVFEDCAKECPLEEEEERGCTGTCSITGQTCSSRYDCLQGDAASALLDEPVVEMTGAMAQLSAWDLHSCAILQRAASSEIDQRDNPALVFDQVCEAMEDTIDKDILSGMFAYNDPDAVVAQDKHTLCTMEPAKFEERFASYAFRVSKFPSQDRRRRLAEGGEEGSRDDQEPRMRKHPEGLNTFDLSRHDDVKGTLLNALSPRREWRGRALQSRSSSSRRRAFVRGRTRDSSQELPPPARLPPPQQDGTGGGGDGGGDDDDDEGEFEEALEGAQGAVGDVADELGLGEELSLDSYVEESGIPGVTDVFYYRRTLQTIAISAGISSAIVAAASDPEAFATDFMKDKNIYPEALDQFQNDVYATSPAFWQIQEAFVEILSNPMVAKEISKHPTVINMNAAVSRRIDSATRALKSTFPRLTSLTQFARAQASSLATKIDDIVVRLKTFAKSLVKEAGRLALEGLKAIARAVKNLVVALIRRLVSESLRVSAHSLAKSAISMVATKMAALGFRLGIATTTTAGTGPVMVVINVALIIWTVVDLLLSLNQIFCWWGCSESRVTLFRDQLSGSNVMQTYCNRCSPCQSTYPTKISLQEPLSNSVCTSFLSRCANTLRGWSTQYTVIQSGNPGEQDCSDDDLPTTVFLPGHAVSQRYDVDAPSRPARRLALNTEDKPHLTYRDCTILFDDEVINDVKQQKARLLPEVYNRTECEDVLQRMRELSVDLDLPDVVCSTCSQIFPVGSPYCLYRNLLVNSPPGAVAPPPPPFRQFEFQGVTKLKQDTCERIEEDRPHQFCIEGKVDDFDPDPNGQSSLTQLSNREIACVRRGDGQKVCAHTTFLTCLDDRDCTLPRIKAGLMIQKQVPVLQKKYPFVTLQDTYSAGLYFPFRRILGLSSYANDGHIVYKTTVMKRFCDCKTKNACEGFHPICHDMETMTFSRNGLLELGTFG